MEKSAGKKFDAGKPRLELLPPSYWISSYLAARKTRVIESPSVKMSMWYFYEKGLPRNFGYDSVPILEFGANKYKAHNWHKGMRWGRLVGAFHRHCNYFSNDTGLWLPRDLDEIDEESGLPHGQHAECCRVFLQEYYEVFRNTGNILGENDCAWNEGEIE